MEKSTEPSSTKHFLLSVIERGIMKWLGESLRGEEKMFKRFLTFIKSFFYKDLHMSSLFLDGQDITSKEFDVMYNKKNPMAIKARKFCEELWKNYTSYADSHFLKEIKIEGKFQDRFWEMYLGATLLEKGFTISSEDVGPDFKLDGNKLWIEAITASDGDSEKPDSLTPLEATGKAVLVNDDKVVLRLRNAIESKSRKIEKYIEDKVINNDEPIIIAINTGKINSISADEFIEYASMSCFGKSPSFVLNVEDNSTYTLDIDVVSKNNGSEVSVDIFLNEGYSHVSAVLLSKAKCGDYDKELGVDYVLVCNPYAKNKLPKEILKLVPKILIYESDEYTKKLVGLL